ncbi:inositol-3-phosphate synthase [Candidatus Thorarchaeota archaeon]|jgi:myo-inositol-1-phosphate synthase|nr:MAG: inositol-3-phosphate synthase [Candidatus Thorarchaeota archaeon]
MGDIRVAIAGLGNCASALVQGVHYYRNAKADEEIPGLMHVDFGGYFPKDLKFVAVFEANRKKIGLDIADAIWAEPNCCWKFAPDLPKSGVKVLPGPISDGVAPHMRESFFAYDEDEIEPVDVAEELKKADADVLVSYLPVGSAEGSRHYAKAALDAGIGFINAIPEFIVSDPDDPIAKGFKEKGLPCAGDDIKSQLGATILHRVLAQLYDKRGLVLDNTYQLNIGGNTDFENMQVEDRLKSKRVSKTEAVTSCVKYELPTKIGPSDYVPFLGDNKVCYITMRARAFGDLPLDLNLKLSVQDSPNSAGVIIDVIRAIKIGLDRGIGGELSSISSYSFKHPRYQIDDFEARDRVDEFIEGKRER